LLPVTNFHPSCASNLPAQAFNLSGVSTAGSTLIEISRISFASSGLIERCSRANVAPSGGQTVVQVVKINKIDGDDFAPYQFAIKSDILAIFIKHSDIRNG
jgi:hypothetical protein